MKTNPVLTALLITPGVWNPNQDEQNAARGVPDAKAMIRQMSFIGDTATAQSCRGLVPRNYPKAVASNHRNIASG